MIELTKAIEHCERTIGKGTPNFYDFSLVIDAAKEWNKPSDVNKLVDYKETRGILKEYFPDSGNSAPLEPVDVLEELLGPILNLADKPTKEQSDKVMFAVKKIANHIRSLEYLLKEDGKYIKLSLVKEMAELLQNWRNNWWQRDDVMISLIRKSNEILQKYKKITEETK